MLETAHTPATAARPSAHTGNEYPKIETEFSSHENALAKSDELAGVADEGIVPTTTPVAGPLDTAAGGAAAAVATGGAAAGVAAAIDGGKFGGAAAGVDAGGVAELFTTLAGSVAINCVMEEAACGSSTE
jgi:hypothetical protein